MNVIDNTPWLILPASSHKLAAQRAWDFNSLLIVGGFYCVKVYVLEMNFEIVAGVDLRGGK